MSRSLQSTPVLLGLLPIFGFLLYKFNHVAHTGNRGTTFHIFENRLALPALFGSIVLIQGLFGGAAFETPERIVTFLHQPIVQFIALFLIAYSGTNDVEVSALVVIVFLLLIQLLRTPKEREEHPYIL